MKILELYNCLEMIRREFRGDYAPQQLSILLIVAAEPGITQPDLAKLLMMPQPTVSRNCKKLAEGYGLVVIKDNFEFNYRRRELHLTKDGESLIARIKTMIEDKE